MFIGSNDTPTEDKDEYHEPEILDPEPAESCEVSIAGETQVKKKASKLGSVLGGIGAGLTSVFANS